MFIFYLTFFIIVVPICIILHEVGHGIGCVVSSKTNVHIYLGPASQDNKQTFRIGKFHFHIIWSYVGFVNWEGELNKRQSVIAFAGGPIMSLLLAILLGYLSFLDYELIFRKLFGWSAIVNGIQFVMTILPMTYPRWMGKYKGLPSDGLRLIRLLRR